MNDVLEDSENHGLFLVLRGSAKCHFENGEAMLGKRLRRWCEQNLEQKIRVVVRHATSEGLSYRGKRGVFRYKYPVIVFGSASDMAIFRLMHAEITDTETPIEMISALRNGVYVICESFEMLDGTSITAW